MGVSERCVTETEGPAVSEAFVKGGSNLKEVASAGLDLGFARAASVGVTLQEGGLGEYSVCAMMTSLVVALFVDVCGAFRTLATSS